MERMNAFDYPLDFQVANAIREFGVLALPEVKKAWEEGKIGDLCYGVKSILWKSGVTYSNHVRLTRVSREERERTRSWSGQQYLLFPDNQLPQEQVSEFIAETSRLQQDGSLLLIAVGGDVRYELFSKLLALCKQNGVYEIVIMRLADPGDSYGDVIPFIRIYEQSGEPRITLQTLVWKLSNKPTGKNKATLLFKDPQHEFEVPGSSRILYDLLLVARNGFRPTKSYKSLPVVLDPEPEVTMGGVIEILTECARARIDDVNFAGYTRFCDWVKELEKLRDKGEQKERDERK
jgi:hypothetical protein